jgi:hypothetical protein
MRLKLLTTMATIAATFAVAGPASAAPAANNGTAQRCAAAQNGNHNGFQCADTVDNSDKGTCPRGFDLVTVAVMPEVDVNNDAWVCQRS